MSQNYKQLEQLAPCPKCKGKHGWYEKLICKYDQFYEANGEACNASTIQRVRGGERRFCTSCDRDITNLIAVRAADS